jgi:hypothetical protein
LEDKRTKELTSERVSRKMNSVGSGIKLKLLLIFSRLESGSHEKDTSGVVVST